MATMLHNFASVMDAHWTTTQFNEIGSVGVVHEDSTIGAQLHKLVDAGGVAGDVVYYKGFTGSFEVTPTIANSSSGEVAGCIGATVAANEICYVLKKGIFNTKANGVFADGTPIWADSGNNRVIPAGVFSGVLTAVTATTVGGIFQVANPCTGAALVTSLVINRTTKSTGAGTMDAGTAADATTGSDNLMDGIDMAAAEVLYENNFQNAGTNGKSSVKWLVGGYINGTASATMAGLVGTYSGTFVPLGLTNSRLRVIGIALGTISGGKVSMLWDLPYSAHRIDE